MYFKDRKISVQIMSKDRKSKNFIQKPVYKGGHTALNQFISSKLQYPEKALKHKIEGNVKVKYTLNSKGKVIKTKLLNGIGFGCDEEAIRLVKLLKFTIPRNNTVVRANFHKDITIHFRLPVFKSPPMQYNYISKSKEINTNQNQDGKSYQITLKW